MKTIYKYPLEINDQQTVNLPSSARLLTVQVQNGVPCLWALVDTADRESPRLIQMFGTGHPSETAGVYIATFQFGPLLFHVFEN